MADAPPNIVERYIGDDWVVGPVTLYGDGQAIDLTGCVVTGVFYSPGALGPAATLTTGNGGIVLATDLTTGTLTKVTVPRDVTANQQLAQDRRQTTYPTRLALVVQDSAGNARTYLLILFRPLDPRSDIPPAPAPVTAPTS